jgi:hypothetical protein
MATIPVNPAAALLSGSASITGSFAGFSVAQAVTFTGLKDANGTNVAGSGLTFASGATIPLFVTSASISAGAILLYP